MRAERRRISKNLLVTDAGLCHLKRLSSLQSLKLWSCKQVTDAGLALLKELTSLQSLDLSGCEKVTDAGLAHLNVRAGGGVSDELVALVEV